MGTFLFILLLVILYFVLSPIVRVWRKVRRFQDEYNRNMSGNTYGGSPQQDAPRSEEEELIEKYRRYSPENAQSVDFEELDGPMPQQESHQETSQQSTTSSTRYQEEAVSDAEYEEIKD